MTNFIKALAENDLFIIRHYDKNRVNDECKKIIDYVNEYNELSVQGLYLKYGHGTASMYISLCNSYDKDKYNNELMKHITRIR